jgi:DNA-binding transcriptional LysR family regulator
MFNLRSLDLNLLTVFEAIYELGTVGGAADRLALSQSATSHALSPLREACNDDLFVRARQGLTPTPVAEAMYPTINQALEALRAGLGEARGFDPIRSNASSASASHTPRSARISSTSRRLKLKT